MSDPGKAEAARRAGDVWGYWRAERLQHERDRLRGDVAQVLGDLTDKQSWDMLKMLARAARGEENALVALLAAGLPEAQRGDAFVRAVDEEEGALVEALLTAGVDANAVGSAALAEIHLVGRTALGACAGRGNMRLLGRLLDAGADTENVGSLSWTPLMLAADYRHTACVKRLLDARAAVNAQDENGRTALHCAVEQGHEGIVEALLGGGTNINLANKWGTTPLMWAAGHNHTNIVKMLLEAGADRTLVDNRGKTALQWAEERGHAQIAELLRD